MSQRPERNSVYAMLGSLGWPLITGLAACSVFYGMIIRGPLNTPAMHRYFATHPVALVATAMFFIGMAALIIKLLNVVNQLSWMSRIRLDGAPDVLEVEHCADLVESLDELPAGARQTYLAKRLRDALEHVDRKGSADQLDDELKFLSELDIVRQQESFALVRIISWATPMLGFLGTVIGITQALGDLNPAEMAASIETAMDGLLSGLYVAFDTTTLALSLSLVLMFVQFLVDRVESHLLAKVDDRVGEALVGRIEELGSGQDPHLKSIQRMCREVQESTDQLVQRQVELWQGSINAAHDQWSQLVETSQQQTERTLTTALEQSLRTHAETLGQAEVEATAAASQRWQQWTDLMANNAEALRDHQQELVRQTELLGRVVQATGDVVQLEQALNKNLNSLAGSQHFEETVMSLSAAIHLLNSRLAPGQDRQPVELTAAATERAA